MSTDQTLPGPASSRLSGPAGIAEPALPPAAPVEPAPQSTVSGQPAEPLAVPGQPATATQPATSTTQPATSTTQPGISTTQPATSTTEPATSTTHPATSTTRPATAAQPATSTQPSTVSSRQAEASGQLVAMSFPGARRVAGWLFWVVFPLLCIATIHASVSNAVHHLGNKPVGIRGTFVVQPRSCSQGFCSFGGLFTSDDHTIRNLPLLGDPRWHTTEVHRVTYDPKSVEVNALPGHWDPTPSVMATFGALTYLVVIGYFVRERQRRSGRSWRRVASSA